MTEQDKILEDIITEYDLGPNEEYKYAGATIIKRIKFPQYTEILFALIDIQKIHIQSMMNSVYL